ncbi:SET and MYND domain-containing protein 4 [Borealophlyctis nickersoniae]|nr:SET and MYND domain-containing protein 4 [Borealophlyctis nickersoniae]
MSSKAQSEGSTASIGLLSWLPHSVHTSLLQRYDPRNPSALFPLLEECLGAHSKFAELRQRWGEKRTGKDASLAESWKTRGNAEFGKSRYAHAVECYNESLSFAPPAVLGQAPPASPLAIAYANRSAALFELRNFHEALADVERALGAGYPPATRYKLLRRKAQCELRLGVDENTVRATFENALASAQEAGHAEFARKVQMDIEELSSSVGDRPVAQNCPKSGADNPAGKLSHLRIRYVNSDRTLITTTALKKGDLILYDHPYASILSSPFRKARCETCMRKLRIAPIICNNCTTTWYCSDKCRDVASDSFHDRECLEPFVDDVDETTVLALRIYFALQRERKDETGLESDSVLRVQDGTVARVPGCSSEGIWIGTSASFLSLFDHLSLQPPATVIHSAITFLLLASHLSLDPGAPKTILQIWAKIRCNSFAIKVVGGDGSASKGDVQEKKDMKIGTGVYLKTSLVNHSCDPNAFVEFVGSGSGLALRAQKEIPIGGDISISYALDTASTLANRAPLAADDKTSLQLMLDCMRIREQVLHPHCRAMGETYDAVAERYAKLGNFIQSAEYCRKSLQTVSAVYGDESIETATEQFKLTQLVFNSGQIQPAITEVNRTLALFTKVFGVNGGGEDLIELRAMRSCLQNIRR